MQVISDKFLLLMVLLSSSSMAYSQGNFSPDKTRQDELLHLLKHDCGACHGIRLLGGLGPALTPEALNSKPNQYISTTILEGHAGTPMPPWKLFINNDEADWLAAVLKKGTAE
jgi:cytochrome c55X